MKLQPILIQSIGATGGLVVFSLIALTSFGRSVQLEHWASCLPTSPQDGSTSSQEPAPTPKVAESNRSIA